MAKALILVALLSVSPFCTAQKWVDDKGRVYYGEPPRGIKVKPAAIKGGGSGVATADDLEARSRAGATSPGQPTGSGRAGAIVEYVPDRQREPRDPSRR
jgi:hypothetical protein